MNNDDIAAGFLGRGRRALAVGLVASGMVFLGGCATPAQTTALGLGAATAVGAYSPDREIEQVYYLGVLDPNEQVDPTIYRIRIHGQASFLSGVKYASGWVPASLVDSLTGRLVLDANGDGSVELHQPDSTNKVVLSQGRQFWSFGPEGLRKSPKDHRLVVVMGASPDKFFQQIDAATGTLSLAKAQGNSDQFQKTLLEQLLSLRSSQLDLQELDLKASRQFPTP